MGRTLDRLSACADVPIARVPRRASPNKALRISLPPLRYDIWGGRGANAGRKGVKNRTIPLVREPLILAVTPYDIVRQSCGRIFAFLTIGLDASRGRFTLAGQGVLTRTTTFAVSSHIIVMTSNLRRPASARARGGDLILLPRRDFLRRPNSGERPALTTGRVPPCAPAADGRNQSPPDPVGSARCRTRQRFPGHGLRRPLSGSI
jgi:hypothetical protein